MSLPWVRLDSNIANHDKVLRLLAMKDGHRAFVMYVCGLGWSGGHGTDGHVPEYVLPHLHGTERHAQMLVEVRLWEYAEGGYSIRNWHERQELAVITEAKRRNRQLAAVRTNCVRYHGKECGCWKDDEVVPITQKRGSK